MLALFCLSSGCATSRSHLTHVNEQDLYSAACNLGHSVKSSQGVVWLKVKSKEYSGQFQAHISAQSSDQMKMEILNPLGGVEAIIQTNGDRYKIQRLGRENTTEEGFGQWGGLPIQWAPTLFLGRIPCPRGKNIKLSKTEQHELKIEVPPTLSQSAERFTFQFEKVSDQYWPISLRWEKLDQPMNDVEFRFSEPDKTDSSPLRWDVKSSRGLIKARWRERSVS